MKYVPERVDGERVYTYVAVDECTRWRYTRAYYELNPASTVDFLFRLQEEAPFPLHTLQTDNGFEFTYKLTPHSHVTHPMNEWCHRYGIKHRLIPPGEKELNGKVERSHRIDEQYFYWQAPTDDIIHFNEKLMEWIKIYNEERLHMGLGYKTPKEKLLERWETLRKKKEVYPDYEFHILRFIKELPIRLQNKGLQQKNQKLVA
ncbi:MAG: transposase family protein [Xanthomonadaceae bacterium]|nr:transposase family protein [Xanthomonadaceae bacterium]